MASFENCAFQVLGDLSQQYCDKGNLKIKPVAGTALLWYNHLSDGNGDFHNHSKLLTVMYASWILMNSCSSPFISVRLGWRVGRILSPRRLLGHSGLQMDRKCVGEHRPWPAASGALPASGLVASRGAKQKARAWRPSPRPLNQTSCQELRFYADLESVSARKDLMWSLVQ